MLDIVRAIVNNVGLDDEKPMDHIVDDSEPDIAMIPADEQSVHDEDEEQDAFGFDDAEEDEVQTLAGARANAFAVLKGNADTADVCSRLGLEMHGWKVVDAEVGRVLGMINCVQGRTLQCSCALHKGEVGATKQSARAKCRLWRDYKTLAELHETEADMCKWLAMGCTRSCQEHLDAGECLKDSWRGSSS